jgi:hypothetical protein
MVTSNPTGGAVEALGLMAAFVIGGLGLAALEREAGWGQDHYASSEMSVASEEGAENAVAAGDAVCAAVWLVDGFNVLCTGLLGGRDRNGFWTDTGRNEVLARAARFDDPEARIVVVFDGPRPAEATERSCPERVFAPSADAWILDALRVRGSERATVVSADRRLTGRARHRGALVVTPRAFLARCPTAC